jgi:hypothetical protein
MTPLFNTYVESFDFDFTKKDFKTNTRSLAIYI